MVKTWEAGQQKFGMIPLMRVGDAPAATILDNTGGSLNKLRMGVAVDQSGEVVVGINQLTPTVIPDLITFTTHCVGRRCAGVIGGSAKATGQQGKPLCVPTYICVLSRVTSLVAFVFDSHDSAPVSWKNDLWGRHRGISLSPRFGGELCRVETRPRFYVWLGAMAGVVANATK
ncbi:hypothetical protein D3C73_1236520 [compost metagenome]